MALDKKPGVRPVGIGETLSWALAKLVMRAAGNQAKTACVNLQLCAGLEAGIEGATHIVGQRRLERLRGRRREDEDVKGSEEEDEEGGEVVAGWTLNNVSIETAGTEEEAVDGLEAALGLKVKEYRDSEFEEGREGTQRALGTLEFLTQDVEPSGTKLVNARNGFNKLSRLAMLWNVRHRWPAGAR